MFRLRSISFWLLYLRSFENVTDNSLLLLLKNGNLLEITVKFAESSFIMVFIGIKGLNDNYFVFFMGLKVQANIPIKRKTIYFFKSSLVVCEIFYENIEFNIISRGERERRWERKIKDCRSERERPLCYQQEYY